MKKEDILYNILVIILAIMLGFIIGCVTTEENVTTEYKTDSLELYQNIVNDLDIVKVYETNDLTYEILADRNKDGKIIIEEVIGRVENDNLDGKILNCGNGYDYISYRRVDGAKEGDIILSYFIYNPDTSAEDDTLLRFDYIIDNEAVE